MDKKLVNALRSVRQNFELYITVVVCAFVLVLKIFHIIEDQWVSSAILVTLMLLAVGNLKSRAGETALRRVVDRLASTRNDEDIVRWYTRRSDATHHMLTDMERFQHIVFIGVSHQQLPSYLRDRLQQPGGPPLPWVSIEIYFASKFLGEAYEGNSFQQNLEKARQDIASILTDPIFAERLPKFRSVSFFQQHGFMTHSGSMFGASQRELAIIYAVHSAVYMHGNTHDGLTIRLSAGPGCGYRGPRFEHYDGMYRLMSQSSVRLGVFARSVWDASARRWAEYARQSDVLAQSARTIARMMPAQAGDSILDVGSGAGDVAQVILDQHSGVSFVLLDGSPQMVRLLRERFNNEERVRVALCQLPPSDRSGVDLRNEKFSFIVVHQNLRELVKSIGNLDELATWCCGRLREDGHVLIAAHNTVIATDPPDGFHMWNDPFRSELERKLLNTKHIRNIKVAQRVFQKDEIVEAFKRHRFQVTEYREEVVEFNYEERRRLWYVPAVFDSVIDGTALAPHELAALVDEIVDSLQEQENQPRTVVYWRFTLAAGAQEMDSAAEAS